MYPPLLYVHMLSMYTIGSDACNDNAYDVHLVDSWGDGWNGATMEISSCDGTVHEEGIDMDGGFEEVDICLPDANGYSITVGGGSWDSEITWSLLNPLGNTVMEGSAGDFSQCNGDSSGDNI